MLPLILYQAMAVTNSTCYLIINVASKKKTTKKETVRKKTARKKKQVRHAWRTYVPVWLLWLGAAIVGLTCWILFRAIFSEQISLPYMPPVGYTVHGIDVSRYQGDIDWELLRNQAFIDGIPLSFVFVKATEGSDLTDPCFSKNFTGARRFGILRGAYHFYRISVSAKQQAEHFIKNVKLEPGDLPPVLDVEVKPGSVSAEDFRQGILEWMVRVEQHYGVRPILYTYHSFRQLYLNDSVFNLYPYWIAHYYVDSVRYQGSWAFWQHSDVGHLPGIKGNVDMNIFNGTYEELFKLTIP